MSTPAGKQGGLPVGVGEEGELVYASDSPEVMLRHFRNVTDSLVRGALDVWVSLWEELQERVSHGLMVLPEAEKGFIPFQAGGGWPEFLEKMWELKHYLDSAQRFIQQE